MDGSNPPFWSRARLRLHPDTPGRRRAGRSEILGDSESGVRTQSIQIHARALARAGPRRRTILYALWITHSAPCDRVLRACGSAATKLATLAARLRRAAAADATRRSDAPPSCSDAAALHCDRSRGVAQSHSADSHCLAQALAEAQPAAALPKPPPMAAAAAAAAAAPTGTAVTVHIAFLRPDGSVGVGRVELAPHVTIVSDVVEAFAAARGVHATGTKLFPLPEWPVTATSTKPTAAAVTAAMTGERVHLVAPVRALPLTHYYAARLGSALPTAGGAYRYAAYRHCDVFSWRRVLVLAPHVRTAPHPTSCRHREYLRTVDGD